VAAVTAGLRAGDAVDEDAFDDEPRPAPRRWPVLLALSLVLLLVAAGGYLVWMSAVLGLRTVQVDGSGAPALAPQVRQAVAVPAGTPLLRIDLAAVRERVAAVGPVATAEVRREWPHTLVVTVTERVPLAATQANGQWWLLDATGKPYRQVPSRPAGLMPIQLATPGEGDRATLAALGVLGALPEKIRTQVTGIVAPSAYDISLTLTGDRTVIWGANSDGARKIAVLPAVLARPGHRYDITDPTLVTVR
jgi:cell division protein FtsQ